MAEAAEKPATSGMSMIDQMTGLVRDQADSLVPGEVRQRLRVPFLKRLWIILAYLLVGTLLAWRQGDSLIGWWIGGLLGYFLLDIDHLLAVWFLHPDEASSLQVKQAFKSQNWRQVWKVLLQTAPQRDKLVLHSIIFEVILAILAVYVVTSKGGLFGQGLILSLWLRILDVQVREFMATGKMNRWFWQIVDPVPTNLQAAFLAAGIVVWVVLSLGTW